MKESSWKKGGNEEGIAKEVTVESSNLILSCVSNIGEEICYKMCGAGLKLRRAWSMPKALGFLTLRVAGVSLLPCLDQTPTESSK